MVDHEHGNGHGLRHAVEMDMDISMDTDIGMDTYMGKDTGHRHGHWI
jgi:hypothetical protein